ncbi:MAG: hypothetical protein JSR80_04320 [Verrucomicrobia bacterium]|nr:hypothetical protein [Verrucomicrobiota bacterium]
MKKNNLTKLALMGLSCGLIIGCQPAQGEASEESNSLMEQSQMTPQEQDFYNKLNEEGKKTFSQMSSDKRLKTMQVAQTTCKGKNSCKGLGGCKTTQHACKGQNSCKGQGGGPVKDPNDAVMMVNKQM